MVVPPESAEIVPSVFYYYYHYPQRSGENFHSLPHLRPEKNIPPSYLLLM